MYITSVSKVLPDNKCDQEDLIRVLDDVWSARSGNLPSRFAKFHRSVQVSTRHLALPKEKYKELDSFTKANEAFIEVGTALGEKAIVACLAQAQVAPEDIDVIFFTTVTGIAVPTIDARLINRLKLRRDIKRVPLFGLGCVAGVAGIARMHDYLKAYPEQIALLLSVELCTLTFQANDISVPNMIATGLFGDGAAAVLGVGEHRKKTRAPHSPRILKSKSSFYYDSENVMGWQIGSDGFKLILNAAVPKFVEDFLPTELDEFLFEAGLKRSDISSWVCHPGGPKVLEAMERSLKVTRDDLGLTWQSLQDVGNISSASVLFVLADTISSRPGRPGDYGVMIAMGPGFCSELVLFQW